MRPCSCPECISACRQDPGRLVPSDLQPLADLLGTDPVTLLRTSLVCVPLEHGKERALALAPAKRRRGGWVAEPGSFAGPGYERVPGQCVFLSGAERCLVHAAKPHECRSYMGCAHTFNGRFYDPARVEEFYFRRWKSFDWSLLRALLR